MRSSGLLSEAMSRATLYWGYDEVAGSAGNFASIDPRLCADTQFRRTGSFAVSRLPSERVEVAVSEERQELVDDGAGGEKRRRTSPRRPSRQPSPRLPI
jgi:hypothetical protein